MAGRVWSHQCGAAGQGLFIARKQSVEAAAQLAFYFVFSLGPGPWNGGSSHLG